MSLWDAVIESNFSSNVAAVNRLSGSLPTEIGLLAKLISLELGTFSGFITLAFRWDRESLSHSNSPPYNVANHSWLCLSNAAAYNQLSGSLPTELGLLTGMEYFDLGKYPTNHTRLTLIT
jgi:hypothetical protein